MHATFARKHRHKHTLTRAPGLAALRDRGREMLREASERQGLDRWDAAATAAWLGDLAALCDEGGAMVVSAVIEDGGVELLMRILRRMSIPGGGWRQAGRGCLRILAIMVECRAALGVRSAHELVTDTRACAHTHAHIHAYSHTHTNYPFGMLPEDVCRYALQHDAALRPRTSYTHMHTTHTHTHTHVPSKQHTRTHTQ